MSNKDELIACLINLKLDLEQLYERFEDEIYKFKNDSLDNDYLSVADWMGSALHELDDLIDNANNDEYNDDHISVD